MLDDKTYIESVVESFYTRAVADFLIGYQFRKIQELQSEHPLIPGLEHFSAHIPKIKSFWFMQLLGQKLPEGMPNFDLIRVHKELSLRKGEIDRWVVIFHEILEEHGQHPLRDLWKERVAQFQNIFHKKLFA